MEDEEREFGRSAKLFTKYLPTIASLATNFVRAFLIAKSLTGFAKGRMRYCFYVENFRWAKIIVRA